MCFCWEKGKGIIVVERKRKWVFEGKLKEKVANGKGPAFMPTPA